MKKRNFCSVMNYWVIIYVQLPHSDVATVSSMVRRQTFTYLEDASVTSTMQDAADVPLVWLHQCQKIGQNWASEVLNMPKKHSFMQLLEHDDDVTIVSSYRLYFPFSLQSYFGLLLTPCLFPQILAFLPVSITYPLSMVLPKRRVRPTTLPLTSISIDILPIFSSSHNAFFHFIQNSFTSVYKAE